MKEKQKFERMEVFNTETLYRVGAHFYNTRNSAGYACAVLQQAMPGKKLSVRAVVVESIR